MGRCGAGGSWLSALLGLLASCDSGGGVPWDAHSGDAVDSAEDFSAVDTWEMDRDGDGFTPAGGDCDDEQARVNPRAYDDPSNLVDDDCDTIRDNPPRGCDCGPAPTLLEGLDICDLRFVDAVHEISFAPDAALGRGVRSSYGDPANALTVREGCAYAILDTGMIEPTTGGVGEPDRQPGTDFYEHATGLVCTTTETDPDPDGGTGELICDGQQLAIELRAPSNASGFSFDFIYISSEYPEWVDMGFNDTFYALLDRPSTGEVVNISFDDYGQEIEVDNAFFEAPPVTDLSGTGYSDMCFGFMAEEVCGSSTGWLRTSWSIDPYEAFTLVFSIHDEGDGIYDSMVIMDNFQWSLEPVDPGTIII